jgi:hypothetical protein
MADKVGASERPDDSDAAFNRVASFKPKTEQDLEKRIPSKD